MPAGTDNLVELKNRIDKISKEKSSAEARRDILKQTYDQKIEELKQAGVSTDNLEQTLQDLQQGRDKLKQEIEGKVNDMESKLKELKGS